MLIVALSDIHGKHNSIEVPDGDVLIIGGDVCSYGTIQEYAAFCKWLKTMPHRHKLVVWGNHDRIAEKLPEDCRRMVMEAGGTVLFDEAITIEGVKFYGTPWTPIFCNWAFMGTEEMLEAKFANIPNDVNILISHGPPFGKLDLVTDFKSEHVGSTALLSAIMRTKPEIVLCGHIHEGAEQGLYNNGVDELGDTGIVNISVLDDFYDVKYGPRTLSRNLEEIMPPQTHDGQEDQN